MVYTIDDVKKNNGSTGRYWTCVDNKVYDITDFMDKHPGGSVISLCAGKDGSDLLESYHPIASQKKAINILKKYYIGDISTPIDIPNKKFFETMQARVEKRLNEAGWGRHFYESIAIFEVLFTIFLYLFGTYKIATTQSFLWCILAGLLTGRLGFFMHMGGHRAMSSNASVNSVIAVIMDFIGGSSKIWSNEHAVAHHLTPNQVWTDNDCSIAYPWLRFHPGLEWKWYHRIQAPLTIFAMTIGTTKWYLTDIFNIFAGEVGSQKFFVTTKEWAIVLFFKFLWLILHIVWPSYNFGLGWGLLSALAMMSVSSHYLENVFIVNHIQQDLIPHPDRHWSEKQVIGSANWAAGSHFWNWLSGGLNHQIEHHLFPSVSHYCYPIISDIVKDTCEEFNLPYHSFDSMFHAWTSMVKYLHRLGQPPGSPLHLNGKNVPGYEQLSELSPFAKKNN